MCYLKNMLDDKTNLLIDTKIQKRNSLLRYNKTIRKLRKEIVELQEKIVLNKDQPNLPFLEEFDVNKDSNNQEA